MPAEPPARIRQTSIDSVSKYEAFALLLWMVPLIAVSVLVLLDPVKRSVTPVFHLAASRWWARESLYADVRGFHYLPQFLTWAIVFRRQAFIAGARAWPSD